MPKPNPQPPTPTQAGVILDEASKDPDWGSLIWVAIMTGARRGELCALRWTDIDLDHGVVTISRSIAQVAGTCWEKDLKNHQQRRVTIDKETIAVLKTQHARWRDRTKSLTTKLRPNAFVFSLSPDASAHLRPDSVTQRYDRMVTRLEIETTLHKLRHYSATELIAAGIDIRTVAGRLGHGGGGTTTLKVYAAWKEEADQRAAGALAARVRPIRPSS